MLAHHQQRAARRLVGQQAAVATAVLVGDRHAERGLDAGALIWQEGFTGGADHFQAGQGLHQAARLQVVGEQREA